MLSDSPPKSASNSAVQDLTLLYELVLSIGQSLDLKKNCKQFLKVLMARKSLKYASVWLYPATDTGKREGLELIYGSPRFWIKETKLTPDHPVNHCVSAEKPFVVVDSASQMNVFQSLVTEKNIQDGVFILFRLEEIGIVKLYSSKLTNSLGEREIVKLLGVIQKFSFSLKACLSHEKAVRENERRQKSEQALRQAEKQLNNQLATLESNQLALTQATQKIERKNQSLKRALARLKKAQANLVQSEKMAGLGQMVAGIAHEINNPVSFIQGNLMHVQAYVTDMLEVLTLYQQGATPAKIQAKSEELEIDYLMEDLPKSINSMTVGCHRIAQLVLSLRSFSRLDEAEQKQVDIHQGIDSTLLILQHRLQAQPNRQEIQVIKKYGDIPQINCYPGQINQVFMHLLSNAIDAIEEISWNQANNEVEPTLTICTKLVDESSLTIRIRDNGAGLSQKAREKMFEPFFTTKSVGKGTGLGLAISYQVVTETHCGSIECDSQPGKGAEFIIRLPLAKYD